MEGEPRYSGSYIGQAVMTDSNLRYPQGGVRISSGVALDATAEAIVVRGPSGRHLLRCGPGKAAQAARIVANGLDPATRTLDASQLDARLLGLLHAAGALDGCGGETDDASIDTGARLYFSGSRDSARRFDRSEDLVRFANSRTVRVTAGGALKSAAELLHAEALDVESVDIDSVLPDDLSASARTIITSLIGHPVVEDYFVCRVTEQRDGDERLAPGWLIAATVINAAVVRIALRSDRWFGWDNRLCGSCGTGLVADLVKMMHDEPDGDIEIASALLAQEIVHLGAEINRRPMDGSVMAMTGDERPELDMNLLVYLSEHPGCDTCAMVDPSGESQQLRAYSLMTEFSERHVVDPKGHQVHYLGQNLQAQSRPRLDVADGWLDLTRTRPERPEWFDTWHAACRYGVGVRATPRNGKISRYSASGGNMGSSSAALVWVIDGIDVVWLYDDTSDEFFDATNLCVAEQPPAGDGDMSIHLIAGIGRLGPKYSHLGYRIALADVGAAVAAIQLTIGSVDRDVSVDWSQPSSDASWLRLLNGEARDVVTLRLVRSAGADRQDRP